MLQNKLLKIFFLYSLSFVALPSFAKNSSPLQEKSLLTISPPFINKDYYLLEYGFVVKKEYQDEYHYNAYVAISLFKEILNRPDNLDAGALGFKAGVLLPFNEAIPLSLKLGTGFARTALHSEPFLGRREDTAARDTLFLIESGLHFHYEKYVFGLVYQINTIKYFSNQFFLTFGVNY